MSKKIDRHKTAMFRTKASMPLLWAYSENYINSMVYDWGCGKGKDSLWLQENGFDVVSYDPYFDKSMCPDCVNFININTILLLYVLNVIEDIKEREGLLHDIVNFANEDTTLIVAVADLKSVNYRAKRSSWPKYNDGFITKSNTFQKGYSLGEFIDCCSRVGKIEKIKKKSGSLIGVVKIKKTL